MLDFGCGEGLFLSKIKNNSIQLFGCDPNKKQIKNNRSLYKGIDFKIIEVKSALPYKNNYFDVITISEVLEHVEDERGVIKELRRVIKKGGSLILSVPNKGLLSFLDKGNLKFRFPRLHKFFYVLLYGKKNYSVMFDTRGDLYGDVTMRDGAYHKHYTLSDINSFLTPYFTITDVYYYSLFADILSYVEMVVYFLTKKESKIIAYLRWWDGRLFHFSRSYGVILKARAI